MERVAFLIDATGEQIPALLNPESLRVRRRSGLTTLEQQPGAALGAGRADDALIATGGGRTEIEFDLLFDVDLARTDPRPTDVRDLTGPIWRIGENDRNGGLRTFRLFWGKRWNVTLVIETISERFDRFSADGMALRSWLRLRTLRVGESDESAVDAGPTSPSSAVRITPRTPITATGIEETVLVSGGDRNGVRVDQLATELAGDATNWRDLIDGNDVDPSGLPWVLPSTVLNVPRPKPGTVTGTGTDAESAGGP